MRTLSLAREAWHHAMASSLRSAAQLRGTKQGLVATLAVRWAAASKAPCHLSLARSGHHDKAPWHLGLAQRAGNA